MAIVIIPGFWRKGEYYQPLAKHLKQAGFSAKIIDLGRNTKGIKATAEIVRKYLESTPEKDDIIAHSFGGIVLKHIIAHYPSITPLIGSIAFVSVPHGGSWYALFLAIYPTARDLLPFRKHIKELSNVSLPSATINFLSEAELKVWPRKGGLLKGYTDIVIPETNHDNIIRSSDFIQKVIEFIKSRHDRIFLEA